jgi:hypothetical protein
MSTVWTAFTKSVNGTSYLAHFKVENDIATVKFNDLERSGPVGSEPLEIVVRRLLTKLVTVGPGAET